MSVCRTGSRKLIIGTPQRDYLMALSSARQLFGNGCTGIHHCQLAAYYKALVGVPADQVPSVLPGMPAASYQKLLAGQEGEEDKEQSLLCLSISLTFYFHTVSTITGSSSLLFLNI